MQSCDHWSSVLNLILEGVAVNGQDPKRKETPFAVVDAVHAELERLAKRDPDLAVSATAMGALSLARELDSYGNSATSKSNCQKELRETMAALWALAPAEVANDSIDELQRRRAKRRAG